VNERQAAQVVRRLFAAFPYPRPPKDTFDLYHAELLVLDYAPAQEAVAQLVRGEERLPPLAVVLREYQAARRREQVELAHVRGLPEPEAAPDSAARARDLLQHLRDGTFRDAEGGR